jgi:hypothetical protein
MEIEMSNDDQNDDRTRPDHPATPQPPGSPTDLPPPKQNPAEPPVSPADPIPKSNPFADLDDDEENIFRENEALLSPPKP